MKEKNERKGRKETKKKEGGRWVLGG